jgi:hypothetical protein
MSQLLRGSGSVERRGSKEGALRLGLGRRRPSQASSPQRGGRAARDRSKRWSWLKAAWGFQSIISQDSYGCQEAIGKYRDWKRSLLSSTENFFRSRLMGTVEEEP